MLQHNHLAFRASHVIMIFFSYFFNPIWLTFQRQFVVTFKGATTRYPFNTECRYNQIRLSSKRHVCLRRKHPYHLYLTTNQHHRMGSPYPIQSLAIRCFDTFRRMFLCFAMRPLKFSFGDRLSGTCTVDPDCHQEKCS